MFNFFKNILGIPPNNGQGSGSGGNSGNFRNDFWEDREVNNQGSNENNVGISEGNVNPFPGFNDPFEIHKFVEQFIDKMFESSEIFRMPLGSIFFSEEDKSGMSSHFSTDPPGNSQSLRDSFLKTPDNNTRLLKKEDVDLDGKVTADEVENYLHDRPKRTFQSFFPNINLVIHHDDGIDDGGDDDDDDNGGDDHGHLIQRGSSREFNSFSQSPPTVKFYSKSVYVESVVKPDGSVKIIKKVQDSNGNDETIIEDKYSSNIPNDQLMPPDDNSGISIFKKFFPF